MGDTPKTQGQGEWFRFTFNLALSFPENNAKRKASWAPWLIYLLTSTSSTGVQIHLSGFTDKKKLGYRGHGSFAQADRAKLNLNVCPSQLSFPELLSHSAHWLFPPALKHSSSPNLDRSKAHSGQGRLWQQQDSNLWVTGSLSQSLQMIMHVHMYSHLPKVPWRHRMKRTVLFYWSVV